METILNNFKPYFKDSDNDVYFKYENAYMLITNNMIDYPIPLIDQGYRYFANKMNHITLKGNNILLAKELLSDDIILYMYENNNEYFITIFYNYVIPEKDKTILELMNYTFL